MKQDKILICSEHVCFCFVFVRYNFVTCLIQLLFAAVVVVVVAYEGDLYMCVRTHSERKGLRGTVLLTLLVEACCVAEVMNVLLVHAPMPDILDTALSA